MRAQGWLLTLERALIFLVLSYLALSGSISVWNVSWLYVLGPAGASLVGLIKLRKLIWPAVRVDAALLNRMLRFSIPIIPTTLIGYLSTNYLDALFITHFLSQAKLGVYSVAYQLAGLTQQLPLLAGTLLMPRFGLLGCAWATVVASGLNLGMIFYLVHWRIVPRRTWVLQATLPILFGAVYASLRGENIGAFGLTAIVSGVISLAHRKSIIQAIKHLGEYGRFALKAS